MSSEQLALSSLAAEHATLETDMFVKTTAEKHLLVEPLFFDERAASVLTVNGDNILKQLIEAKLVKVHPTREDFLNAVRHEGGNLNSAWRNRRGIEKIKL